MDSYEWWMVVHVWFGQVDIHLGKSLLLRMGNSG